jgi:3-isopropylmalate/(R)-2-methylmalate dehydratase small subunit
LWQNPSPAFGKIQSGETITINFASGEIITSQDQKFAFPPLPEFLMGILKDGGLIPHVKKSRKT